MTYLEAPERTDDQTIQERDAAETFDSLLAEVIERTCMDPDAAAKLSVDTMYCLLSELDTAEDEYETWADMVAAAMPPEALAVLTGNVYDPEYDTELPF